MAEFEATPRRIGSSVGIIIPKDVVRRLGIRVNRRVRVSIPEKMDWSDIWGKFKSDTPTGELIRKARTERD
ncbi:MAG: AbrB/MazE/SpoVT family DNA-binding domain-containing protein [Halobacteria archaeon]